MPLHLKRHHGALLARAHAHLTENERRDVAAFDHWFTRGGGWRWLVAILMATTLAAAAATQLPWNMSFLEAAALLHLLVFILLWTALSAWFGHRRYQGKVVRFAAITVALALLGGSIGASIVDLVDGRPPLAWILDGAKLRHIFTALVVYAFVYVTLTALIAIMRNREYAALTRQLEGEAHASDLSRQLAESQLRILQMQIEPHFLFNTLGSAQQLAERDAPEAARLIADLISFLRAATGAMREQASTLRQEALMISAYLAIMRTRLGARLRFTVDVAPALESLTLPPGTLITLVENAIKHGIEPLPTGGEVRVTAVLHGSDSASRLEITVSDNGAGLSGDAASHGTGLCNLRERLALLYGDQAMLELFDNEPRGFVARVILPVDRRLDASTSLPAQSTAAAR